MSPRATMVAFALVLIGAQALEVSNAAQTVTPVEKVITLLDALKTEIENEGTAEAQTYDSFACFCKSTTETKSTSITTRRDTIDTLSSDIEVKTAEQGDKVIEVQERRVKQEEKTAELEAEKARCQKALEDYQALAADLSKAISSLTSAFTSMDTARTNTVLLQTLQTSLTLADAYKLKVSEPKRQAVTAFLRVDPLDPTYKYQSSGIITILDDLLTEFRQKKADADAEWLKEKKVCKDTKDSLKGFLMTNKQNIDILDNRILDLKGEIADDRSDLVEQDELLKDDQQYLKDLTERCETRAKDWDQRSALRKEEISSISGALAILNDDITSLDTAVNLRAMPTLLSTQVRAMNVVAHKFENSTKALSFLQDVSVETAHGGLSMQARQEKVAALLGEEGKRLGSEALATLALKIADDPFGNVKVIIQKLIERLLQESTAEATKKGFCDTELGKAHQDRDFRIADAYSLNAELEQLEVKQDELEAEIASLTASIADLKEDLNTTTILRQEESVQNYATISTAKDGVKLMKEAIAILTNFYKQAAKATLLVQASPVDEDTDGAGFAGAYNGKQVAANGIIGMLQVILTDFQRTVRLTEAAEAQAHVAFVLFDRAARADISGKEMKKELDEQDLETTITTIAQKMDDLQSSMDRCDDALRVIEALVPTCIDTGMSYAERVAKFNQEIAALKKALCILDEDGVESQFGCSPQPQLQTIR